MENSSSSLEAYCENSIKHTNLLFSMDYDSGYISHNPESNFDSSLDNNEHLTSTSISSPIYLSEDALLETPEVNKYPNISLEIEKEDFEETRHIFNSPFLGTSTTTIISASIGSREISYSGFETEESNASIEIPRCKQLTLDNICVQMTTSTYNSPDLNDEKREAFKDLQHSKNSVFNNITNTLSTNDPKKKLTLIFSKDDKENVYSVKRKYHSITPDKHANEENSPLFLPTQKKIDNANNTELSINSELANESASCVSNFELLKYTRNANKGSRNLFLDNENSINEQKCVSAENRTNEFSTNLDIKNGQFLKLDDTNTSPKNENLSAAVECSVFEDIEATERKDNLSYANVNLQTATCDNIPLENVNSFTKTESTAFKDDETKNLLEDIDQINILSSSEICTNLPMNNQNSINDESGKTYINEYSLSSLDNSFANTNEELNGFKIVEEREAVSTKSQETSSTNDDNLVKDCKVAASLTNQYFSLTDDKNKEFANNSNKITKNSINLITSVVKETLEEVVKDKAIQDLLYKRVTDTLEINKSNSANNSYNNNSETTVQYKDKSNYYVVKKCVGGISQSVTSTPEKSCTNPINSSLSPDLFTDDQIEEKPQEIIQPTTSTPKERNMVKKDYMILRRAQNNLKGVIPPRSLTMIQISVPEMLNKIENNKKYCWNNTTDMKSGHADKSDSLLLTCSLESCKNKDFPDILKDRCFGLFHNRSKFSEEFEELCVKYGQRYVGAETQSSCTVFDTHSISPTKRKNMKPQWNLKSPGKRLSHLARRRITFSSANLQSGNSFWAGSRARQILVDAKKMDLLSRRKSPRKSPRKTPKKTPRKSPRLKTRTPSSSAKKKLAMRFRKVTGEIEKSTTITASDSSLSAKRNLFHSPDEDKKLNRLIPSTSGTSSLNNDMKRSATKRALFMSPSKSSPLKNMGFKRSPIKKLDFGLEKKRKRTASVEEPPSKFARCYSESIPPGSDVRTFSSRARSDLNLSQNRQIKELTTNHKKKLQLAIYEALRSQNILPTHPQFKVFASNLGRLTRQLFLVTTAECVGVTEKMLRIARYHVIAVVKGKSPEEIYEEFVKNRAKNLKPQGYVAPEKPSGDKREAERRVLGVKTNFNSDSKIDRIRKAINFGDDDNR